MDVDEGILYKDSDNLEKHLAKEYTSLQSKDPSHPFLGLGLVLLFNIQISWILLIRLSTVNPTTSHPRRRTLLQGHPPSRV